MRGIAGSERFVGDEYETTVDPVAPRSVAELIASIDQMVEQLRSGRLTGRQLRVIARERRRIETAAWAPIRGRARMRSGR
jgi:hypothetical protein